MGRPRWGAGSLGPLLVLALASVARAQQIASCADDYDGANSGGATPFIQDFCVHSTFGGGQGYQLKPLPLPTAPCGESCTTSIGSPTPAETQACLDISITGTDYTGGVGTDRRVSCEGTAAACTYQAPAGTCQASHCCDDIDDCDASPCEATRSVCVDTAAPDPGHNCECAPGYFGADSQDGVGCQQCSVVTNADSVTCTQLHDSRAVCSTGYEAVTPNSGSDTCEDIDGCSGSPCATTASDCVDATAPSLGHTCTCAGGYFGADSQDGNTCTECDSVPNAASVTCVAAGNSRATCSTGFVHTVRTIISDICDPPTCDSTDACSPCPDGSLPTGGANCDDGSTPATCFGPSGNSFVARRDSCEDQNAGVGCTYIPPTFCSATQEHIIDTPTATTCNTFPCASSECCTDNICTCNNGVPGVASNHLCTAHGRNQCASCHDGFWRDGNFECQACTTVANAWPEGTAYTCSDDTDTVFAGCGGHGEQPCCADGYYFVGKGTAGNDADECRACASTVANANPQPDCVPGKIVMLSRFARCPSR